MVYTFSIMKEPRLRYAAGGQRAYPVRNVTVHRRKYWEFQAVVDGRIAPLFEGGAQPYRSRSMWIFEPECAHHWVGEAGHPAQVVVFHLPAPDVLLAEKVADAGGWLSVSLTEGDCVFLRESYLEVHRDFVRPDSLSHLRVRGLLDRLTLLALERLGYQPEPVADEAGADRVDAALYWYERNLDWHPTVADVARAIAVSEAHLRRLFLKSIGRPPRAALQDVLFRHAGDLLRNTGMTLEAVAEHCGYAGASSFSRAWKARFGSAPGRGRG